MKNCFQKIKLLFSYWRIFQIIHLVINKKLLKLKIEIIILNHTYNANIVKKKKQVVEEEEKRTEEIKTKSQHKIKYKKINALDKK